MIINKSQLKTGKCPVYKKNDTVNAVLAVRKDSYYCKSNTYIGKWDTPNAIWYNKHIKDYEGYIELEFLIPKIPKDKNKKIKTPENKLLDNLFDKHDKVIQRM